MAVILKSGKKLIAVVLITMTVILSLPILAVASMGTSALSFFGKFTEREGC